MALIISDCLSGTVLEPGKITSLFSLRFNANRAREERGTYVARKGVIGHDIVFGQVHRQLGQLGGVPAEPLRSDKVFGARPWDDEDAAESIPADPASPLSRVAPTV